MVAILGSTVKQLPDMLGQDPAANAKLHTELRPPPAAASCTITVIMPAYNSSSYIERSLSPLLGMKHRGEILEVIVVDDGSTDETREIATSRGASVISTGGRRGPAAARNLGAGHAGGDVLWFVDSDFVARSDAARQLRGALASHDVVAVFGSYDECPEARNFFSQYKNLLHHHHHHQSRGEVTTFWAGCGGVWRERFWAEHGFDANRYPRPSIEDIEFGYRLSADGGRIRVVPELQGTHLKTWTLSSVLKTDLRDRAIPWAQLLLNREGPGDVLNVGLTERIRALIASLCAFCLAVSLAMPTLWWLPAMLLLCAYTANLELFMLFRRRNGMLFALGGLLFHQFYYLYSALIYSTCWIIQKSLRFAHVKNGLQLECQLGRAGRCRHAIAVPERSRNVRKYP